MSSVALRAVFYTRYAANRASRRTRACEYLDPLRRLGNGAVAISRVDERGAVRSAAFEQVCDKAVQYQSPGLPVVASPVDGPRSALRDGLFARTPAQWRSALASLAADHTPRGRLGQAGRAHVGARHSIQANVKGLAAVLLGRANTRRGVSGPRG